MLQHPSRTRTHQQKVMRVRHMCAAYMTYIDEKGEQERKRKEERESERCIKKSTIRQEDDVKRNKFPVYVQFR